MTKKEIAKVMNNGIKNDSTLHLTTKMMVEYCILNCPEKLDELQSMFIPESAFNKPHKGLDATLQSLNEVISASKNQEAVMRK